MQYKGIIKALSKMDNNVINEHSWNTGVDGYVRLMTDHLGQPDMLNEEAQSDYPETIFRHCVEIVGFNLLFYWTHVENFYAIETEKAPIEVRRISTLSGMENVNFSKCELTKMGQIRLLLVRLLQLLKILQRSGLSYPFTGQDAVLPFFRFLLHAGDGKRRKTCRIVYEPEGGLICRFGFISVVLGFRDFVVRIKQSRPFFISRQVCRNVFSNSRQPVCDILPGNKRPFFHDNRDTPCV